MTNRRKTASKCNLHHNHVEWYRPFEGGGLRHTPVMELLVCGCCADFTEDGAAVFGNGVWEGVDLLEEALAGVPGAFDGGEADCCVDGEVGD